jgi:hypothetical protein
MQPEPAEVDEDRRQGHADGFERCFDDELGLGPRDQHVRSDLKRQPPEFLSAGDVLERLAHGTTVNGPFILPERLSVYLVLYVRQEPGAVADQDMTKKDLCVPARIVYLVR